MGEFKSLLSRTQRHHLKKEPRTVTYRNINSLENTKGSWLNLKIQRLDPEKLSGLGALWESKTEPVPQKSNK